MSAPVEEIIAELAEALCDGVLRKHALELAQSYAQRILDANRRSMAELPRRPFGSWYEELRRQAGA